MKIEDVLNGRIARVRYADNLISAVDMILNA